MGATSVFPRGILVKSPFLTSKQQRGDGDGIWRGEKEDTLLPESKQI